mmetsp:Transcript_25703/g.32840  ORF Transcript_25703/g.32840 Transcript_25703/m.32840 type:complete len:153 (-) Transcript_25703:246-704(-)
MPLGFNSTYFHTIRYPYRTSLKDSQQGKSIVDVSRHDGTNINNPHRLLGGTACTGHKSYAHNSLMSFRVHHYVGSLEAFRRPGFDARGLQKFHERNRQYHVELDNVATLQKSFWLADFVSQVGKKRALALTETLRQNAALEIQRLLLDKNHS